MSDADQFTDSAKFMESVMEVFDPRLADSLDYTQRCRAAGFSVAGYNDFDSALLAVIASVFDTPVSVSKDNNPFEAGWYGVTLNTEAGDINVEIGMVEVEPGVYSREAVVQWPSVSMLNTKMAHSHIVKRGHLGWTRVRSAARAVKEFSNVNH